MATNVRQSAADPTVAAVVAVPAPSSSASATRLDLLANAGAEMDPVDRQLFAIAQSMIDQLGTLADVKGIDPRQLEAIYGIAYNFYQKGKYQEAVDLFQFLCLYDHLEEKYWYGLGACRQMLKQYASAVDAYSMAATLNLEQPDYPLFAAECHLALGNLDQAESGAFAAGLWAREAGDAGRQQRAAAMMSVIAARKAAANQTQKEA